MHTDEATVKKLANASKVTDPLHPQTVTETQAVLALVSDPEYVGCHHLRFMLKHPDEYGCRHELVASVIQALMKIILDSQHPLRDHLEFVVLKGDEGKHSAIVNALYPSPPPPPTHNPYIPSSTDQAALTDTSAYPSLSPFPPNVLPWIPSFRPQSQGNRQNPFHRLHPDNPGNPYDPHHPTSPGHPPIQDEKNVLSLLVPNPLPNWNLDTTVRDRERWIRNWKTRHQACTQWTQLIVPKVKNSEILVYHANAVYEARKLLARYLMLTERKFEDAMFLQLAFDLMNQIGGKHLQLTKDKLNKKSHVPTFSVDFYPSSITRGKLNFDEHDGNDYLDELPANPEVLSDS